MSSRTCGCIIRRATRRTISLGGAEAAPEYMPLKWHQTRGQWSAPPPLAGKGWGEGAAGRAACCAPPPCALPRKRGRGRCGAAAYRSREGHSRQRNNARIDIDRQRPKQGKKHERRSQPASDRAFRRQHPAAGRRDRVPHRVGRGRTAPRCACRTARPASARPGSASCRTCSPTIPAIELAIGRAAVQVHAVGRQGRARNSAPAREARRHARRRRSFKTGYADMAIESWGMFDRLQQAGVIPPKVKFQISLPTPIAPTYNNMVPTDRPELLPALTEHLLGEVAKIAQALAQRPHRAAMGRVPGGAGLGGLLRAGPGRLPDRDDRRARRRSATPCRPRSSSAITCATAARPTSTWCSRRTPASWSR